MPAATEEQKAAWRAMRALRAGREPLEEDLQLLGQEEVDKLRQRTTARQAQIQSPQTQEQPLQQPLPPVNQVTVPHHLPSEKDAQVPGTGPTQTAKQERKALTVSEKRWYDFWHDKFGPMVILVLFVMMRDWDKARFYAPSPQECNDLATPMAHISAQVEKLFKLPEQVVAIIIVSEDVITLGYVFAAYAERTGVLDKLVPWFSGTVDKVRKDYTANVGPIRNTQPVPAPGPDTTNGNQPIDLRGVVGLGAQWSPSA